MSQSGQMLMLKLRISRSRRVSLQWGRPAHSVARPMRMPMHISNGSWNCATLLSSRESRRMRSDSVCFRSLLGKAKQWFYTNKSVVTTWDECAKAFLAKFFPLGKTNALRGRISSSQQASNESITKAWEQLQEYILACPHHGMDAWLILQNFYNRLTPTARDHIDAAASGAFFSLTIDRAKTVTPQVF
ncbi:hypothetical protein C2845_PM01G48370 [Panicum miliaceum]|uniref:Retrotransposon gag domain-containing protein n=1 Tax=Panicum miliaceum TaxID=4540 RepID=A0A3L6TKK0_PANMI|nr:hypothetical protein C2845_PM01G48370 [Panicum miliaceum]